MRGAVFLGDRKVELVEFPDPAPGPRDVVIEIRASGMCGSDLHYYRGTPRERGMDPTIAGHEPAGVIVAAGSAVRPQVAEVGARVMVHHYSGCEACEDCRSGWPQMCRQTDVRVFGASHHGAHAPLLRVPASTVVPLPEVLSFQAGAAIGCGTGTAWGALERLGDIGGSTLAVFGQGPVGHSATMLAAARGARVIAVDPEASRRERAVTFGASATVDPDREDAVGALRELTGGAGPELIVETSGSTDAASAALDALARWGRVCFVGLGGRVDFSVRDQLRSQMTLMTSWTMSVVAQRRCAEFVVRHQLPVDELFTDRWGLGEVVEAYRSFDLQAAGKGVLVP